MPTAASGRAPLTVRGRRVVRELRRLREELGWTLEEAAAHSHISAATVSRMENGDSLRVVNVAALLSAYGVTGQSKQHLVALAKQAKHRGWWSGIDESVMSWPYKDLAELEQEATWKKSFEPLVVPGLLQTAEYADSVLRAISRGQSEEAYAEIVAVRMRRQERVGELDFTVLLLEEVLRRRFGDTQVMVEQLERLLEESTAKKVEIKVLPYSANSHPGILGNFSLLGGFTPLGDVVASVEAPSGMMLFEDDDTIFQLRKQYEALDAESLTVPRSRRLIERVRKDLVAGE
jgi:transcriptional regulator with XRE-family HTH domain